MFFSRNKKNNVYPYKAQFYCIKVGFSKAKFYCIKVGFSKAQFYYIKVGFKGVKLYRYAFVMARAKENHCRTTEGPSCNQSGKHS